MEILDHDTPTGRVSGSFDTQFSGVVDAYIQNFQKRDEVGASLCVAIDGEVVVDVWGGTGNQASEEHGIEATPWEQDTVCTVFSSTKGATALAAHLLISRGELELEQRVGHYWPEFEQNGKASATVRMMLDHSVGLPTLRDPLKADGAHDWDYMVERLAQEEPFWKPGTRNGYHMITFGWTVGELVRRVSGESLGTFFRKHIAEPTDAEFWIGLPEELEPKVVRTIAFRPQKGAPIGEFTQALISDRNSLQNKALFNQGGFNPNGRASHAAEVGGAGGIGNGRGLAKIYAPFAAGGTLAGREYVTPTALARMTEVAVATHEDATLLLPTRFGLGFMKSMDNRNRLAVDKSSVILGSKAFGHVGAGGSIGFADPESGLSFGYVMNRMGEGILLNERGQSLVDATYRALGFAGNESGVWFK